MTKVIDLNGFWKIEDNPITKEGVFPYLGEQISPDLEPKKIYMVYRPASELTNPETIESFNGVPFIDEHEMVGEGFTKYDQRPAGGVLFNPKAENGILVGDFKIFSETMKDEISNGKKELSLGYLCDYELKKGVWNGQYYDAVQKNIRGNHVALVERGRMGSDVRVYDKAITMDALDIEIPAGVGSPKESGENGSLTDNQGKNGMKYVSLEEVKAILKDAFSWADGETDPKEKLVAQLLDEKAVEGIQTQAGDEDPEAKKADEKADAQDECGEVKTSDEDAEEKKAAADEDEDKKPSEDEDDDKDDKGEDEDAEEKKAAEDEMPRKFLKMIAHRNEIVRAVEPHIGSFACDEMTAQDAAVYACKKLGLQANAKEAELVLRGYLAASKSKVKRYGLDSAVNADAGVDKATVKYLKGE